MHLLTCADCGSALRKPRRGPLPRRCSRCGKRRRNARARLPDVHSEVLYNQWEAAALQRALEAEQARLDALREAAQRSADEVARLRRNLACLARRERPARPV